MLIDLTKIVHQDKIVFGDLYQYSATIYLMPETIEIVIQLPRMFELDAVISELKLYLHLKKKMMLYCPVTKMNHDYKVYMIENAYSPWRNNLKFVVHAQLKPYKH